MKTNKEPIEEKKCNCPDENGLWCYRHSSTYIYRLEPMEWENEFHKKFAPVGGDEFDWDKYDKTIHFISSLIKQAEERVYKEALKSIDSLCKHWYKKGKKEERERIVKEIEEA
jgi:hypothetical protein